jgi:hypothetical protein
MTYWLFQLYIREPAAFPAVWLNIGDDGSTLSTGLQCKRQGTAPGRPLRRKMPLCRRSGVASVLWESCIAQWARGEKQIAQSDDVEGRAAVKQRKIYPQSKQEEHDADSLPQTAHPKPLRLSAQARLALREADLRERRVQGKLLSFSP